MIMDFDLLGVILSVIVFVLAFYFLVGKLGRVSIGRGTKFDAFSGGEELPPERGKYHSELFVYAALFVAFEVVGLLIASSIAGARVNLATSLYTCWGLLIVRANGLVCGNRGC